MRIVYTAIFGDYDELNEPLFITPGVRYICFTDQQLNSKNWELVYIEGKYDNVRNAREIKINFHKYMPFFKEAMWIDANQKINCDVNKFFENDFTVMEHPDRNCIYKEAEACLKLKKDSEVVINGHVKRYEALGYPENTGLVATGLMIRKNTNKINSFCEKWFMEIMKGSKRDQLSFNYVLHNNPVDVNLIPFTTLKENFIRCDHK